MGKKVGWALVGALVLLFMVSFAMGCSPPVKEEDKQLVDQQEQIADLQDAELVRIEQAVQEDPELAEKVAPNLLAMRQRNSDSREHAKQLKANLGAPTKRVPYTPESAKRLRDDSAKAHEGGFWKGLGAGALATGLLVIGLARKFGRFIPGVGSVITAFDSTLGAVEEWMQEQKDAGKPELAASLATKLGDSHYEAGVQPVVESALDKVKEKMGYELKAPSPPPPAAPAPAV